MFPAILEVVISMIVVYFLLSTVVSFIKEIIAMIFNTRGKILYRSLEHLFVEDNNNTNGSFIKKIYNSDYVNNLASKFSIASRLNKKPSYIATENFAGALIDEIQKLDTKDYAQNFKELKKKIESIGNSFIKTKLLEIVIELEESGQATIANFKKKIADWFDSYMETVTTVYKNYVSVWVFCISFFVCFSMNIDSIVLMEYFYKNKEKREIMLSFAENVSKDKYIVSDTLTGVNREKALKEMKTKVLSDFTSFGLPYGWKDEGKGRRIYESKILGNPFPSSKLVKFLGLFITTVSLTLGAPFWYQMMVSALSIKKATSESTTKSTDKKKKDNK
jgi:hypothetical protein